MTLISPGNLQYILGLSISSRVIVFIVQFISNTIIYDHNADAYRNRYQKALSDDINLQGLLPNSYRYIYWCIEGFTKWDAQYFLEISLDGYVSEQHLAFLPLYPIMISTIRQILFEHVPLSFDHFLPPFTSSNLFAQDVLSISSIENYIQAALVGVAINNFILMPMACIFLFALTKLVKKDDDKYAKIVVWWFCFNPASIFFSSCYSESLFASLTFLTMFVIEYRSQKYLKNHLATSTKSNRKVFEPLSHLNRLLYISLPALVPFALASATRSNSLITIGFIIYQFLVKYAPMMFVNQQYWTPLVYLSVVLELIQDVLVLVMSSVLAASGYISFQIYSYIRFCANYEDLTINSDKKSLQPRPFWCDNYIPHPYGHVQAKYWNVGLFNYYEVKQLPNFLLAMPISLIVMFGSLKSSRGQGKSLVGCFKQPLAYYIQAITMTLLCSISINIQVITRLLASSCPAIYWICVDMANIGRKESRIFTTYFLSYFIIGTILHTNFYPWT